jgi:hypothetical protein
MLLNMLRVEGADPLFLVKVLTIDELIYLFID